MAALIDLWHAGWIEAHAEHVPAALTRLRTKESFDRRLSAFGDQLRVTGPEGAPTGLCVAKGEEIDQLFVSPTVRGGVVARALLADGEARIAAAGHREGVLFCAIGNDRAARFYTKCGWRLRGEDDVSLATSEGAFSLRTWVFVKRLD
ncbi:MAG: GNAT family N-acetyltransferase [Pseudomonadota bacterium]